ncbi:tetratricopeptide repeat protein [Streptomyces sp. NPDC006465]|uniref:tetratricopeptide repeat protein n=1 Tax=Streptomyces sp. NPDC006465 TaxID=3157174 RepID=UPI0033A892B3
MSRDTGANPGKQPKKLRRAVVGAGPLRQLKDLLFEAYTAAGEPTLDQIAAAIRAEDVLLGAPGRDTIRRCISDPDVPAKQADVVAVAVVLAHRAGWDVDHTASRITDLWVMARLAGPPPGKPLHQVTDPFTLEVHRAISVNLVATSPGLPALPVYVEREHDAKLRVIVENAKRGKSQLVMLTGGSSTGKTRACWEAVRHLSSGWRLWHPYDPTHPEAALAGIEQLAPHTVVWLNEAQHYLLTTSDLGERLAAKLRTLLADQDRKPVLILGSLWPEYWNTLISEPEARSHEDPHAQARALLTGRDLTVPSAFSNTDLRALADRADEDPRLGYAADRAENGAITQFLAGAPALLERHRTAPDGARALIEAAMDARRLGHGFALPQAMLQEAAPGYLSDTQWDLLPENWLEQALAYSAKPLHGARGTLTLIRPRPGQPAPAHPHYRLADYLEEHGRLDRHTAPTPDTLWKALLDHAPTSDRLALARSAQARHLYRIAFDLYASATDTGKAKSLRRAADWLDEVGRLDEALPWYEGAAGAGDLQALRSAADCLVRGERLDEALPWYQRAADAGDAEALGRAGGGLLDAGRLDEALTWYERAAHVGNTYGLRSAARQLVEAGHLDEMLSWYECAAHAGDTYALGSAAKLLVEAGRLDEALTWYERAAHVGNTEALRTAAEQLGRAGQLDEALTWYERAAHTGDNQALYWGAELLVQVGRLDEMLSWYERAADAGNTEALRTAGDRLDHAGRLDEALTWYERAAHAGDTEAPRRVGDGLVRAGRLDEALTWYEHAAHAGDTEALRTAAEQLVQAGQLDEALTWYERAADAGNTEALRTAGDRLDHAGRLDEALTWYERAAHAGDTEAPRRVGDGLVRAGRLDEALTWYEHAGDARVLRWGAAMVRTEQLDRALPWYERAAIAGDTDALRLAADRLAEAERLEEALSWYERAAIAGDMQALREAAGWLAGAGRLDEALSWYERAAHAGNTEALRTAAEQLGRAGQLDEALTWYERAAHTGDNQALFLAAEQLACTGRLDEALIWYERAAVAGDNYALFRGAERLEDAGRPDDALSWYERAAVLGGTHALWSAERLAESGQSQKALSCYERAADAGETQALRRAVDCLARSGQLNEARQLERYGWEPDRSIATTWIASPPAPVPSTTQACEIEAEAKRDFRRSTT